jgi:DNA adenine methylase
MKYMGSKNRISKYIVPLILENIEDGMPFIDACCGGCNIIDKIPNTIKRYANDINSLLIAMFKGLQDNLEYPSVITKEYYSNVRTSFNMKTDEYSDFIKGFVGFMGSYNGRFFDGGYSGHSVKVNGNFRDYIGEAIRNIEKQITMLQGVKFTSKNILDINPNRPSLIYCDIPYKDTKKYKTENFDYEAFYEWCLDMKRNGNVVMVSEYDIPERLGFETLWQQEVKIHIQTKNKHVATEKLFILK